MTPEDAARAAEDLSPDHELLVSLFEKREARRHAVTYLRGLMTAGIERKAIQPIAMTMGDGKISALQKFINTAPWRAETVFRAIQRRFAALEAPATLVVVEKGFPKKGNGSVGVGRQWDPTTGRRENCQVGAFLLGCTGGVTAILAGSLFLPESWFGVEPADQKRRDRVRIPPAVRYRPRPRVGASLVELTLNWRLLEANWLTVGSTTVGGGFLDELDGLGKPFLVPIRPGEVVAPTTGRLASEQTVYDLAAQITDGAWSRAGAGPTVEECAAVPVRIPRRDDAGRPLWLYVRRRQELDLVDLKYYLANVPPEVSRPSLGNVFAAPAHALSCMDEANRLFGLSQYETRSWFGWHHHTSLVALAHWLAVEDRLGREAGR